MGESQVVLRILLADTNTEFAETVKEILRARSNGVRFDFYWHNDTNESIPNDFDVYIIDQSFVDLNHLVKVIKKIQKGQDSRIIVVGNNSDVSVLKLLMKLGIHCFVDKTDEDLEPIFDAIKDESESKCRILKIQDNLQKLYTARCKLDNTLRALG